jgi:hypothetical protein
MPNVDIAGVLETYTVDTELFDYLMMEGASRVPFRHPYTDVAYLLADLDLDLLARECNRRLPRVVDGSTAFTGNMPMGLGGFSQSYAIDGAAVGFTTVAEVYREVAAIFIDVDDGLVPSGVVMTQREVVDYILEFAEALHRAIEG